MDVWTIIGAVGAGLFPWVSQFKKLDIHFKIQSFNLKSIFNFFASLFGASVFLYLDRLGEYDLIYWPNWSYFIITAFILTMIYFVILIYKSTDVNSNNSKWPICVNFLTYISIFVSLTIGFGLLNTYSDYFVIKGVVVSNNGDVVENASITVMYKDNTGSPLRLTTQRDGEFAFLIKKEDYNNYNNILVQKVDFQNLNRSFSDVASLKAQVRKMELQKLNNP